MQYLFHTNFHWYIAYWNHLKMKSIVNAHPFFPTSLPLHQCLSMLMVSHHHPDALFCTAFSWFLSFFGKTFFRTLFAHVTRNGTKYLFSMQTDILHIIAHAAIWEFFKNVDVPRRHGEKIWLPNKGKGCAGRGGIMGEVVYQACK